MAHVLFLLETPTPQRTPTLDALAAQGVHLFAYYHRKGDTLRGWGAVKPKHPHVIIPSGFFRSAVYLTKEVAFSNAKVLCCFGYSRTSNLVAVIVGRIVGAEIVTRSDSNWLYERSRSRLRKSVKKLVLIAIFGSKVRVWTVGKQNDRYWAEMGAANRHSIPYEVPNPPVGSVADGRIFREKHLLGLGPVLLYVGMLEHWKGIDLLIEAFETLSESLARLVIVGQGTLYEYVARAAAKDSRIVLVGPLKHDLLGAAYAAADLLVVPSRRDAWGLVVNEAQANGRRVVVSDAVGCAIDRVDELNGWTFASEDRETLSKVLASAIEEWKHGWEPIPVREPGDTAMLMLADLRKLGVIVSSGPTQSA